MSLSKWYFAGSLANGAKRTEEFFSHSWSVIRTLTNITVVQYSKLLYAVDWFYIFYLLSFVFINCPSRRPPKFESAPATFSRRRRFAHVTLYSIIRQIIITITCIVHFRRFITNHYSILHTPTDNNFGPTTRMLLFFLKYLLVITRSFL